MNSIIVESNKRKAIETYIQKNLNGKKPTEDDIKKISDVLRIEPETVKKIVDTEGGKKFEAWKSKTFPKKEAIVYNKKGTGVFGKDLLNVLNIFDKSAELIATITKNKVIAKTVIDELKELDKGGKDQILSVEEFDSGFKNKFKNIGATPNLLAAVCCLASLITKHSSIFNQKSTLKQQINSNREINSIKAFLKGENEQIFKSFYTGSEKEGYKLNNENKNVKTLSEILPSFGEYRLSDELAEKFTSFEASKTLIAKVLNGAASFGHGGVDSPEKAESKELGKNIDKNSKEVSDIVSNALGEPTDKIEDKASDEAKEKAEKAENELGGSDPKNAFGLGISIPEGKELVEIKSMENFIADLKSAFDSRLEKLKNSFNEITKNFDIKNNEKKDRENSEKNKYTNDLVKECLKKFSFVLEEEEKDKLKNKVDKLQKELDNLFEKHEGYFESRTQDFTKTVSKLCGKYQKCNNYQKSIDIRIEIFNAYVDYSYFAAKTIKGLKKEVDILTKEVNEKIDDLKPEWEDPKEKEWKDNKLAHDTDKKYEALKLFLTQGYSSDIKEITKYLLVNILTDKNVKGTDNVIKLINGSCSEAGEYLYVGSSGAIYATDRNSVKGTDGKVADLSNIKAVPYKNVSSLIAAAGLKMSILSRETIKKFFDDLKINNKLSKVKEKAGLYIKCCNNLKTELIRASSNNSTVTEGLFDFKRKAKFDGIGNDVNDGKGAGFNKFSTTNKSDNKKEFLTNNSYSIELKKPEGSDGYQFNGDGPEDIALRQLFKGLVAIKGEGDSWYVMSGDSYKQYLKLKDDSSDADTNNPNSVNNNEQKNNSQKPEVPLGGVTPGSATDLAIQDNANKQTGQVMDSVKTKPKVSVTTDAVDSTYPTAAQQKIKKICYGMGNDGRVTIKSKEFFDK